MNVECILNDEFPQFQDIWYACTY